MVKNKASCSANQIKQSNMGQNEPSRLGKMVCLSVLFISPIYF
ncbi:hypothetical protein AO385_0440 [Moraxella catarrhalis]|uniref:Uncharacterized protein n=1 Tax=Moraxella catarrhalis TaxID=480 RepID=A0A198UP93_MORCA|nr:hypothetical protein AO384_0163 [Moraxella catarrhalis]OAU98402.1 hypothetical protein AO383_0640 [Moraxella catarrhalis]OAV03614.1 hypothetical protein AO385_0440 [Moraxella catarrhalis]